MPPQLKASNRSPCCTVREQAAQYGACESPGYVGVGQADPACEHTIVKSVSEPSDERRRLRTVFQEPKVGDLSGANHQDRATVRL